MDTLRLGINIDHVATLRNARGGATPDPVRAALAAQAAGADGITAHLREDRRHIRDEDMAAINEAIDVPLNFEMAATEEMARIALATKPHAVCLVPERREERTTEGGLEVAGDANRLTGYIAPFVEVGARVSLFIAPDPRQIEASLRVGAAVVELHTGAYCHAVDAGDHGAAAAELERLTAGATFAHELGLEVHAGHGLSYDSVGPIAALPEVVELNIGHFLIGEAVFRGLDGAIAEMRRLMDLARSAA
ncbi:pyridoxine 5'-phosphate synthase [Jannaschia pagri]|uniref:Pyridoxine 5'-phosphate synthase n=1 Tax=Jannaschia pagri TaxID=2829797 RepID=A0ABQ4NGX7_9RHOB|nr:MULTISPECIES: pyridoxine 5'-phosphate synthase [unclassified Jannaschia]GIT90213.1 pyridoxine 5'-phosphate synthase [Jannaschia sp. AI_61]GIT93681.1 pyridoxine 5'-phosphate synthase [Jannaschia sp. AI_62]